MKIVATFPTIPTPHSLSLRADGGVRRRGGELSFLSEVRGGARVLRPPGFPTSREAGERRADTGTRRRACTSAYSSARGVGASYSIRPSRRPRARWRRPGSPISASAPRRASVSSQGVVASAMSF